MKTKRLSAKEIRWCKEQAIEDFFGFSQFYRMAVEDFYDSYVNLATGTAYRMSCGDYLLGYTIQRDHSAKHMLDLRCEVTIRYNSYRAAMKFAKGSV